VDLKSKLLAVLVSAVAACAAPQPWSPDDIWTLRSPNDPQISPDGSYVLWMEEWNDRASAARYSNIWVGDSVGKSRHALTESKFHDSYPRWSSDGKRVAYLSDRGGSLQIHIMRADGSGDVELTHSPEPPRTLAWSPDGESIAFTMRPPQPPAPPSWAPKEILPWIHNDTQPVTRILVIAANGGASRPISPDSLDFPGEPAWSPDSQLIYAAAVNDPVRGGEIFAISPATGIARQLTRRVGPDEEPIPSPDGTRIAWLGHDYRPQSYTTLRLSVMNRDGTREKLLSGNLDRDVRLPRWSSDSRTIYFLADDRGATHVYAARADGTVRQVTHNATHLRGLSLADNGRAAVIRSGPSDAGSVVTFAVDVASEAVVISAPNATLMATRETAALEEMRFMSEGQEIQSWLIRPPRFDPAHKYPLLVDVHDSPGRMEGFGFSLGAQIFAAQGFVVMLANPRGSAGYGEQFGNLLRTRFPGGDFDDVMHGVDAAISKGYIDPQRVFIRGGTLAAWAIASSGRFAAAVVERPVSDWTLDVALDPDGPRHAALWMQGLPWEDPQQYRNHSPIYAAGHFKTPALILAPAGDPQGRELYFALRSRNTDVTLLAVPPATPRSAAALWDAVLGWFSRFR
jgi:acylaminoacyl-peptidase